ncbi:hypothetical protein CEE69_13300 [Rhodopirellula bahusiensis]|uniref:Uncharacterized protein n=1 Tax=Rhodopirellula bahusiensis TaxID=2014065 RepID=A0A2G1W744_9BACT|nr:hypothetical protein CEE69_13300 [Rhodopirellula bahusiensis]
MLAVFERFYATVFKSGTPPRQDAAPSSLAKFHAIELKTSDFRNECDQAIASFAEIRPAK